MGSRISGTGVDGCTRGKERLTRLRKRILAIRISSPGGAGQTRGRERRTRFWKRFLGNRISGTGVAGKMSRTRLRHRFSGGMTQLASNLPINFVMSARLSSYDLPVPL